MRDMTATPMSFSERYRYILDEIADCCRQAGRDPGEVKLLAVSKTVGDPEISAAIDAGIHSFGENRPDRLQEKALRFPQQSWHFIGNIQSRRISDIVACSHLIHSLYQKHHLLKIDEVAGKLGKVQDVLLEVNVSGEASKSGLRPDVVGDMLAWCADCQNVRVRGLMTMAPQGDLVCARHCFEELAQLRDTLRDNLAPCQAAVFNELSMGMSEDWREAIGAGTTMVRIGRALFDEGFGATLE